MIYDILYMAHALIIWVGSLREIYHIFKARSARDVTIFWVACLLSAEILALPRSLTSDYWVWYVCHIVGAILTGILLFGVIKYRKK